MKSEFLFVFYLLSGIVIGSLVSVLSKSISWLSWLSFGTTIGFGADNPAVLDLSVLKIAFGISISITVAHIICIAIAMTLYYGLANRAGSRR